MDNKRISISRTEGEWQLIDKKIKEMGQRNFNKFLRDELIKIKNQYADCPKCITAANGDKERRQYYFYETDEISDILEEISIRMKKPISAVIDDIIISPLLYKK